MKIIYDAERFIILKSLHWSLEAKIDQTNVKVVYVLGKSVVKEHILSTIKFFLPLFSHRNLLLKEANAPNNINASFVLQELTQITKSWHVAFLDVQYELNKFLMYSQTLFTCKSVFYYPWYYHQIETHVEPHHEFFHEYKVNQEFFFNALQ